MSSNTNVKKLLKQSSILKPKFVIIFDEQKYFNYKKKFEYVLIEKDMIEKILFDRNLSDIFILCLKNDVSINELACFN